MTSTPRSFSHRITGLALLGAALGAQDGAGRPAAEDSLVARALRQRVVATHDRILAEVDLWRDHSTWEQPWRVDRGHVSVRTTIGYPTARRLAEALDAMLPTIQEALGVDRPPPAPLVIHLFPDMQGYNTFGEQHGEHHSSFYGSFHATAHEDRPVAAVWNDNPVWLRIQVTHSLVHAYLDAAFPQRRLPVWAEEGLAAYFACYWDYGWSLSEFERLRDAGRLVPLARLLGDDLAAYAADAHTRFTELGMLFYYLLRYCADTRTTLPGETPARSPFRDWLVAGLRAEDPASGAVTELLADPAALERDLRSYEFPR